MPLTIITTPPPSWIDRTKRKFRDWKFKWKHILESKFMSNEDYLWEAICNEDLVPLHRMEKFIRKHAKKSDILERIKPTYHGYHGNKDKTAVHMALAGRATTKTVEIVKILLDIMEERMKERTKNNDSPIEGLTIVTLDNGDTPLHLACGINYTRRVMAQEELIIQLTLETISKHPPTAKEVMTLKSYEYGEVAFHIMCRRRGFHLPLYQQAVRICPQVLSMLDKRNHTPLHMGCKYNTSFEINEYLMQVTPYEALHVVDDEKKTALHTLSETMDQRAADLIPILIQRAPMLCFAVDSKGKIPFEYCLQRTERRMLGGGQLDEMMKFKITLEQLYDSMLTTSKSLLGTMNDTIQLNFDLMELLYMDNEQMLVGKQTKFCRYVAENESFRNLLLGIETMNTVGKRLEALQEGNKERGVRVIESVINNLDCIYLHLRENPSLCKK